MKEKGFQIATEPSSLSSILQNVSDSEVDLLIFDIVVHCFYLNNVEILFNIISGNIMWQFNCEAILEKGNSWSFNAKLLKRLFDIMFPC